MACWFIAATIGLTASQAQAQSVSSWQTAEYFGSGALAQINAAAAYALGYTGSGVRVGVVDSGLDTRHPEFTGRVVNGYDFTNDVAITSDEDHDLDADVSHGTHVAGIIAAARNGVEMHGVAFNATLTPIAYNMGSSTTDGIFADTWNYVAAQKLAIVNNSVGFNNCARTYAPPCNVTDYTRAQAEALYPNTIQAMKAVAAAGTLMVFATGNEAQTSPDVLAGMPYLVPELKNNWLAVTAVDSTNTIASFSNHCGVAKDWCLAAPGVGVYSTVTLGSGAGTDGGYNNLSGTSMATPVVSGVAALVKEAFPWFTAYDLQQVLLTTATDLGAPGVDEVYGWGLVNAGKAVLGYGQFTSTVSVDTQGLSSTFANDITGVGGLIKTGSGTLFLTGTDTYTGATYVEGGTLSVNGSIISPTTVGSGGTLRGTGTIQASLDVFGRLAPGNSPGTLTVAGPVSFATGSAFETDIDGTGTGTGAGNYSRLVTTGTSGTVTINGGTIVPLLRGITGSASNSYVPALGSNYTVILASAGLTGAFSDIAQPTSGLPVSTRFDALYSTTSMSLVVTPLSYGMLAANGLAATTNTNAAGSALDSFRPAAGVALTGTSGILFGNLYTLAPTALPAAVAQLSGEAHASVAAQTFDDARQVRAAIFDRLDGSTAARIGTDTALLSGSLAVSLWATGYGGWGDVSSGGAYKLDWNQSGFIGGADVQVLDSTRVGLAFGVGQSSGDVGGLNSSTDNSHTDLALYGATQMGAFLAKYGAAYSWNSIDIGRSVVFGELSNRLNSNADGHTTQVFGELSYGMSFGPVQFTPFAGLAYVDQSFGAFSETGGAAALSGSTLSMSTTLSTLGARVSTDIALGGGKLTPSAKLGWQHAFGDVDTGAVMWFAGSSPFLVEGAPIARDALALNLGLAYGFSDLVTAAVSYDGVIAENAEVSTIKGNLKVAF
ncbi:outer membrane autotransporter barrel domain-containing protein [Azorhizobium oxalatiphilum]|uniref:Outer membrane autotransporter barrel domain-containing protein n=1 Tax=Azorhizobium oxalatiphilum TaxID=980631 RepID=A0A917CAT4_9HYPH|nr:outer membrane autotransporter barrel domain-containing protein [Azorhizobium oxalatiphilum]